VHIEKQCIGTAPFKLDRQNAPISVCSPKNIQNKCTQKWQQYPRGGIVRHLEEREKVLNMYFHEGMGYTHIASVTGIPFNTVKSWCRRYRIANGIPERGNVHLSKEPIKKESVRILKPRDENTPEARISRLEMEVELLRNFLILTEEK
jgi:hypothetical protein